MYIQNDLYVHMIFTQSEKYPRSSKVFVQHFYLSFKSFTVERNEVM